MTIAVPNGYGKLVGAALRRPLLAIYEGVNGVAFDGKHRLFGLALSSYYPMPVEHPTAVSLSFVVGAFSLKAARRELLAWSANARGLERVVSDYRTQKELGLSPETSPLTEMPPELMIRLDFDPGNATTIPYKRGAQVQNR